MASEEQKQHGDDGKMEDNVRWKRLFGGRKRGGGRGSSSSSAPEDQSLARKPVRWNMGMRNDSVTEEVPGSILLLSKVSEFNEPLGKRHEHARRSASSLPSFSSSTRRHRPSVKKRTPDGKFVLEPQPDDSANDPLTWPMWRRDLALLSLGFYCMLGGGMTPVLAAGFNEVAQDYGVSVPRVALTTGLYMLGLGVGSVVLSPTAILYGKRPVYLAAAAGFLLTSVWCALSPNFTSLLVARMFMGVAVSSVECLPSATVAEIYFLHEKAYRLGIYTLLLLSGKNIIPLVSAVIIQSLHWRWVFWIVAIVVGFGACLLFLFVPETFWDRTPVPSSHRRRGTRLASTLSLFKVHGPGVQRKSTAEDGERRLTTMGLEQRHAHFKTQDLFTVNSNDEQEKEKHDEGMDGIMTEESQPEALGSPKDNQNPSNPDDYLTGKTFDPSALESQHDQQNPTVLSPGTDANPPRTLGGGSTRPPAPGAAADFAPSPIQHPYTRTLQSQPRKTFLQQLKPYSGRINADSWVRAAIRPFILFAFPAILWSTLIYSLSIGWLIVLSESVAAVFESRDTYNFTPLQAGLVYISPFIGGVLGTAVAGKVSDLIVRALARRNGGIYEPEFRLVMAVPIALTTVIGLMGYGWSVAERDSWIVPTIFFGIISFGCSLGSTTAITFAVDSYRQYAGEALVTLNFSKNIFHGLVFSLFFNKWLDSEGSKDVFLAIGGIQLACLLFTVPMYVYGKRARMWTVRQNLMKNF